MKYCYALVDIVPHKKIVLLTGQEHAVNKGHLDLKLEMLVDQYKPVGYEFDTHRFLKDDVYIIAFIHRDVEVKEVGLSDININKYNYSMFNGTDLVLKDVLLLPTDKHMMAHMLELSIKHLPDEAHNVTIELNNGNGIVQYKGEK